MSYADYVSDLGDVRQPLRECTIALRADSFVRYPLDVVKTRVLVAQIARSCILAETSSPGNCRKEKASERKATMECWIASGRSSRTKALRVYIEGSPHLYLWRLPSGRIISKVAASDLHC